MVSSYNFITLSILYHIIDVLRSSGLTRQQEVTKMFTGGLQRVARLTVDEYENQKKKNEERQAIRDQKKVSSFFYYFVYNRVVPYKFCERKKRQELHRNI